MGEFRAGGVVASISISRGLGLMFGLTLVAMTNEWPDTVFEELVLVGKLGVCLRLVIPLACHRLLGLDPQFPVGQFYQVGCRMIYLQYIQHLLIHNLIILDPDQLFQIFLSNQAIQPVISDVEIVFNGCSLIIGIL